MRWIWVIDTLLVVFTCSVYTIALKLRSQSRLCLHMKGFGNPNKGVNKQQPGATTTPPPSQAYRLDKSSKIAQKTASDHIPTINLDFPGLRAIYGDPPIFEVDSAFSVDLCQAYMDRAQNIGDPRYNLLRLQFTILPSSCILPFMFVSIIIRRKFSFGR